MTSTLLRWTNQCWPKWFHTLKMANFVSMPLVWTLWEFLFSWTPRSLKTLSIKLYLYCTIFLQRFTFLGFVNALKMGNLSKIPEDPCIISSGSISTLYMQLAHSWMMMMIMMTNIIIIISIIILSSLKYDPECIIHG